MQDAITYANRKIKILYDLDTVVIGGGTAGAIAGISAARNSCKTVIIEKSISLGGSQTNGLVTPMMATYVENFSINNEIIYNLELLGCRTDDKNTSASWFNPEKLSYVLEDMAINSGCSILYDTVLVDVLKVGTKIDYVIVSNSDGLSAIKAKTFIDCSGDAILSRLAGVPVDCGDADGNNQLMTFRFEMGGINIEALREYMSKLNDNFCSMMTGDFYEIALIRDRGFVLEPDFIKGLESGELEEDNLRYFQAFTVPGKKGVMSFNCPHILKIIKNTDSIARSEAVTIGRKLINKLSKFLIKNIPGFENAYLSKEASLLGIRESYRIKGKYTMTEEDYLKRARFNDGIAKGDWYLDVHYAEERGAEADKPFSKGEYYEIPYRSMVTNEVSNLIVAGRCISTSFLMQSSIRIQRTVRDLGQIAGEACGFAVLNKLNLNELDGSLLKKFK